MFIKQISAFVENRPGRIAEITEILASHNIDLRALSVADTTDFTKQGGHFIGSVHDDP